MRPGRRNTLHQGADLLLATSFPETGRNYAPFVPGYPPRPYSDEKKDGPAHLGGRKGARRLLNEHEVLAPLQRLSFEAHDHETMKDDPRFFRSAEMVVGPDGAGLANIAFCNPATKVLEIPPSDHLQPFFYRLANAGGFHYGYRIGQSAGHRPPGAFGPSPYDLTVDATAPVDPMDRFLPASSTRSELCAA